MARLVALVPRPRLNLTRFHGVFAPNSKYRARVTPAKRGRRKTIVAPNEAREQTPAEQRSSMTWAKRLKRVFNIDIETCRKCGGEVKIIASIEDPTVIKKILAHLNGLTHPAGGSRAAAMPCLTTGGPGRSILKIRASFHWMHFIRRQGIGRPAGRNQHQKNAKR